MKHPDCQMPDGGDPCAGFAELSEAYVKLGKENAQLHAMLHLFHGYLQGQRDLDEQKIERNMQMMRVLMSLGLDTPRN
jgi:hypothetical protein